MEKKKQQNKYQMGQKIWFLMDNEVGSAKVTAIIFAVKQYRYYIDKYDYGSRLALNSGWPEEKVFSTKEELLKSL